MVVFLGKAISERYRCNATVLDVLVVVSLSIRVFYCESCFLLVKHGHASPRRWWGFLGQQVLMSERNRGRADGTSWSIFATSTMYPNFRLRKRDGGCDSIV